MHRLAAVVVALLLSGACSGAGGPPPTSLPPTTAVPTPFQPTGTADVVRRFVDHLDERQVRSAYGLLTDGARARAGGETGFRAADDELAAWGRWGSATTAAFDALPIDDDLAIVVLRGRFGEDEDAQALDAAAVAVRPAGDRWAVDAFGDVGRYQLVPEPGSEVGSVQAFAVVVEPGVEVVAFVDGQPATGLARTTDADGRERVELRSPRPLGPGEHVVAVALVDEEGEAAARAAVYVVPE